MVSDEVWAKPMTKRFALPPTDTEVSEFEDFERRWQAIQEEGEKRDWLDNGGDGAWLTKPQPAGYETRLETDEEVAARVSSPWARSVHDINERFFTGFKERLERESALLARMAEKTEENVTFPVHARRPEDA